MYFLIRRTQSNLHSQITHPLHSAAPFKATVGSQGLRVPLDSSVDAGAVVEALFGLGKPPVKRKEAPVTTKTGNKKQQKVKRRKN